MYNNNFYRDYNRQGFVVPFLFGALAGGAAVGVSRPRPVIATGGYPPRPYYNQYPYYQPYPYFY